MSEAASATAMINPVWVDVAVPIVKAALVASGTVAATDAGNEAVQIVGAIVTVGTFVLMVYSRFRLRAQKKAAIIAPAATPIIKLHL